jgi:hypothetical protein
MKYAPRALTAGAVTSATAVLASFLLFIFVLRLRASSHPIAPAPEVSPVPPFVISTVPIATAMIMIVSLAANTGNWRADRQQSTLAAAAVRAWSAEAQGAYMANAWDAAAMLLERASKLAPEDETIRHRQRLVEQKRTEAGAALKTSSER